MLHASASGYRTTTAGALSNVGAQGDYWSSSPDSATSANADGMWLETGRIIPIGSTNRAYGFTVRCVQHLRIVFYRFPGKQKSRPPKPATGTII
ncbi:MAG: fibrobacter succinogenes major paralogous domain-containing protein [Alistipes sp.]|nr:fibrobacter succinogenes major paralogous domain-containing protein [Alistipes sp.]